MPGKLGATHDLRVNLGEQIKCVPGKTCSNRYGVKGPLQAAKYDESYKAILTYIRLNYDNNEYNNVEYTGRKK